MKRNYLAQLETRMKSIPTSIAIKLKEFEELLVSQPIYRRTPNDELERSVVRQSLQRGLRLMEVELYYKTTGLAAMNADYIACLYQAGIIQTEQRRFKSSITYQAELGKMLHRVNNKR